MSSYIIIVLAFLNIYLGCKNVRLEQKLSGNEKELSIKSKEYRSERIWAAIIILQVIISAFNKTGYLFIALSFQIASLALMVKLLIDEFALKRKKDN